MTAATKARLLLIDDSLPDLRVLTEMARAQGWSVAVAFNGKDGYHKALLSPFDLILLDLGMPTLDGFGTCRLLKANPKTRQVPVIFLSAAGEQANRLEGLLLGAVDYIVKSYANTEEIVARININLQRSSLPGSDPAPDRSLNEDLPSAPLVRAAKSLLLRDLARPPAAADLARQIGSSDRSLNDAFREQYGMTVYGWLRDERLRTARDLILATDLPIVEISESLGYSTPQNFATAFRARFECTPSHLREQLRKPSRQQLVDG